MLRDVTLLRRDFLLPVIFIRKFLLLITALIFFDNIYAQLCQGSLGDPVVNITFGAGSNFGSPLSATLNNYNYVPDICPNDGSYTIANSTQNCFFNSWLTLTEDHTPGDANGYMMIVNASISPGIFYIQTVDGLCGGTTYEFAAWLCNVLASSACGGNGNKPNITFEILTTTDSVLQTYKTGDIANTSSPVWTQYGLYFTTPPNISSVVIKMTNNAPGGCGNDVALDDITFRPCGPKVSIKVNGLDSIIDICTGSVSGLNFTSNILSEYPNTFYQWQKSGDGLAWSDVAGTNTPVYSIPAIATPGKYFYRLAVAAGSNISLSSCRVASDAAAINVHDLPTPLASNNSPACEGAAVTLTAAGGGTYSWIGPNNFTGNSQSPTIAKAVAGSAGMYYLTFTSSYGCINRDSTAVVINLNPPVDAGRDVDICEGGTTTLQGSGVNVISYRWTPTAGLSDFSIPKPIALPSETTLYILTVDDGVCKASDSVLVTVAEKPVANAGPDKVLIGNTTTTLSGEVGGTNVSYFWTPDLYISSTAVLNPQVSPPYDTAYTLHVISNDGCGESTDKVLVRYFKDIYIPNAFSPNNDGVNDLWRIPVLPAFPSAEVSVYNRYGQLVFFNKGYTKQWDGTFKGTPQSPGVYCYIVDLKNGLNKLSGIVILMR